MTQATYKSTRLLIEAINREMDVVRKAAMGNMALGSLNELRELVAQLAKRADRIALDDVDDLGPIEYVTTMKPVAANYHRVLMKYNQLAPCLCMDLRAAACVIILVGDDKSVVRTAHDPNRPDAALAVEAILESLDGGTKEVVEAGVAAIEAAKAVEVEVKTAPLTVENIEAARARVQLLEEAERVGWDTTEGEELRAQAKDLQDPEDS